MKNQLVFISFVALCVAISASAQKLSNPSIDMPSFLKLSQQAAKHRSIRRVTEDEFIRMSREAGVVILDARSKQMYDALHIRGAVNLSFPDIAVDSLAGLLPDKNTKILIYCNNNFANSEAMSPNPFPTKVAPASLNLSTYISLYTYGYRNVYELGPLLDVEKTKLDLVSSGQALALKE